MKINPETIDKLTVTLLAFAIGMLLSALQQSWKNERYLAAENVRLHEQINKEQNE